MITKIFLQRTQTDGESLNRVIDFANGFLSTTGVFLGFSLATFIVVFLELIKLINNRIKEILDTKEINENQGNGSFQTTIEPRINKKTKIVPKADKLKLWALLILFFFLTLISILLSVSTIKLNSGFSDLINKFPSETFKEALICSWNLYYTAVLIVLILVIVIFLVVLILSIITFYCPERINSFFGGGKKKKKKKKKKEKKSKF